MQKSRLSIHSWGGIMTFLRWAGGRTCSPCRIFGGIGDGRPNASLAVLPGRPGGGLSKRCWISPRSERIFLLSWRFFCSIRYPWQTVVLPEGSNSSLGKSILMGTNSCKGVQSFPSSWSHGWDGIIDWGLRVILGDGEILLAWLYRSHHATMSACCGR